ncbi:Histone acetyltransferase HPA2 and related acetyltransferases, partial [uncultured Rubrobacteraceae bacterium]
GRGIHHQARTQGRRDRGGAALDAERRGAHGPRPGLRDLTRRRANDAPLSGRRGEQQLLLPLCGRGRRQDGRLYLGRAPSGLPRLSPEDVGLGGRRVRRTRAPQPRRGPRPPAERPGLGAGEGRRWDLAPGRRRQRAGPQVLRRPGVSGDLGLSGARIL